jgi:hypothetical protein
MELPKSSPFQQLHAVRYVIKLRVLNFSFTKVYNCSHQTLTDRVANTCTAYEHSNCPSNQAVKTKELPFPVFDNISTSKSRYIDRLAINPPF